MNRDARHEIRLADGDAEIAVTAHFRRRGFLLDLPNGTLFADGDLAADGTLSASLDGARLQAIAIRQGDAITLFHGAVQRRLVVLDPLAAAVRDELAPGRLTAPMPGKIAAVLVAAGDRVTRGAALMVVEAMKMEHTIAAPRDGVVERINYGAGDLVDEGAELLVLEEVA
jgi:3-methylcrotonyl-CoA carboxylase alpha subunit